VTAARWKVGAAVGGAYVAIALATFGLSSHRMLPLFEGFAPPVPYRWVHPPPQFAASNVAPVATSAPIAFNGGRSLPLFIETPDIQCAVTLSQGALVAHDADRSVQAEITPVDPATLGPVPSGLAADGNAYRITLTYEPSGTQGISVALPGDLFMTTPHRARVVLFSADGRSWSRLPVQSLGAPTSIGAAFGRPGWYLVGTLPSSLHPSAANRSSTIIIAVIVALATAGLGTLAALVRRRHRRRSPP